MRLPSFLARPPAFYGGLLRWLLLGTFAVMVGRHWHPFYGYTAFLQIDPAMAARAVPEFEHESIYKHPVPGSYDGGFYAQIAIDPSLRHPALREAIDDFGYRGRRILLSAVAWICGGGEPVAAARAYAWLNIALWFALAALLWRVFPVSDPRATLAWGLLLFGAGPLFSVRLALTDLATVLLTAGGVMLFERGRANGAAALLGLAGLTRETGVLGAAALLETDWPPRWKRVAAMALRDVAVLLPIVLWVWYVRETTGSSSAGASNLAWPLTGWAERWMELFQRQEMRANPPLYYGSILAHLGLTVQLVYLALRPQPRSAWWRVGATYVLLCGVLGYAVWEGFPNATSRVLLPMTLAFNVCVVRARAAWLWLVLGNLSVVAGVYALQAPTISPHELPSHGSWSSRHLLLTDDRWAVAEWTSQRRWAWCGAEGGLTFRTLPTRPSLALEIQVRGISPRTLEVWHANQQIWRGDIGDRPQWIRLPELPTENGRVYLELRSPDTPVQGAEPGRQLSFACFGARIVE